MFSRLQASLGGTYSCSVQVSIRVQTNTVWESKNPSGCPGRPISQMKHLNVHVRSSDPRHCQTDHKRTGKRYSRLQGLHSSPLIGRQATHYRICGLCIYIQRERKRPTTYKQWNFYKATSIPLKIQPLMLRLLWRWDKHECTPSTSLLALRLFSSICFHRMLDSSKADCILPSTADHMEYSK